MAEQRPLLLDDQDRRGLVQRVEEPKYRVQQHRHVMRRHGVDDDY